MMKPEPKPQFVWMKTVPLRAASMALRVGAALATWAARPCNSDGAARAAGCAKDSRTGCPGPCGSRAAVCAAGGVKDRRAGGATPLAAMGWCGAALSRAGDSPRAK
ncbi:MAG: hypothetical protein PVSMB6_03360 [Steroidobacteraceae bacterium]